MKGYLVFVIVLVISKNISAQDIHPVPGGKSGDGMTTRYWDCCAPSCAWNEIVHTKNGVPVQTCNADGYTPSGPYEQSGCAQGGTAYTCTNQAPKVINDTLVYAFVAASFAGGADFADCCICLQINFKGELAGKTMLAQVTNTGTGLQENHFDLLIPGGGVGDFNLGCQTQWGAPTDGWGEKYGGVTSIEGCNELPAELQDGCKFRFTWMKGVSNPSVSFQQIECLDYFINTSKCGDPDPNKYM